MTTTAPSTFPIPVGKALDGTPDLSTLLQLPGLTTTPHTSPLHPHSTPQPLTLALPPPMSKSTRASSNARPSKPARTKGGRFARKPAVQVTSGGTGDDTGGVKVNGGAANGIGEAVTTTSVQSEESEKRGRKRTTGRRLEVEEQPRKRQRSSGLCEKEKGVNGNGVGVNGASGETTEKRVLRSQEKGARNKTILDTYFPWIDEEWAANAKENEYVGLDTIMTFLLPPRRKRTASPEPSTSPDRKRLKIRLSNNKKPSPPPPAPTTQFPTFDFTPYESEVSKFTHDPLPPSHFFKAHRRMEVSEKRLRNIERERVAHEISKLETQMEVLKGNDWLKALGFERTYGMGVEERKRLEVIKDDVVAELEGIMEKYKYWREDEKRKRRRDDRRKGRRGRAESEVVEQEVVEEEVEEEEEDAEEEVTIPSTPLNKRGAVSGGKTPKHVEQIRKMEESPFVSFYKKPHLRAQALKQSRRSVRNLTAFGVSLPAFLEKEFELPVEIIENADSLRKMMKKGRTKSRR